MLRPMTGQGADDVDTVASIAGGGESSEWDSELDDVPLVLDECSSSASESFIPEQSGNGLQRHPSQALERARSLGSSPSCSGATSASSSTAEHEGGLGPCGCCQAQAAAAAANGSQVAGSKAAGMRIITPAPMSSDGLGSASGGNRRLGPGIRLRSG